MILSIAVVLGQARLSFQKMGPGCTFDCMQSGFWRSDRAQGCFVRHPRGMFLFDALRTHSINFSSVSTTGLKVRYDSTPLPKESDLLFRKLYFLWKWVFFGLATEVTRSEIGRCCKPGTAGKTTFVHIYFILSSTRIKSRLYPFRHLLLWNVKGSSASWISARLRCSIKETSYFDFSSSVYPYCGWWLLKSPI